MAELVIRRMEPADLELALDWAAGEGWNPGRRDARAFREADPEGLLMGCLEGEPVAAIACPRYDDRFGFVGLYLVRPDLRGRGLGMSVWRAGHDLLGERTSGLDAVDAQVGNYERSGYRAEGHTYGTWAGGRARRRPRRWRRSTTPVGTSCLPSMRGRSQLRARRSCARGPLSRACARWLSFATAPSPASG